MSTGRSDGPSATSTTSGTGRVTSLNSTMISEACQALSEASNLLRQALSAEGTLPHSIASSAVPPSRSNVERGTVVEDPLRTRHIQSPPLTQSIPSTSTPTSTMRPSRTQAIRDELSRCFRSNTRSRSRHGRSSTSARETVTPSRLLRNRPTWPHIWVALAIVGQDWVPTIKERRELMKAGLGEKKLQMPVNLNGLEVIEYLNDAYPKLENAGGVEICRTSRGSRKLEAITCPAAGYTQHYLSLEAGQAKLYIRPIQRGLDLTPVVDIDEVIDSIENVENAPTEKCSICSADIPYNLIREHFENCSTETIEDIFADEPVDNASDPNEETIDEVTVNEEAAIEEPVNAETINTETINTETINAETINAETINTGQDMMAKAQDYGGPRKEFFVLVLRELKEKYFDNGLKEHMAEDYETVGKIMALSMLQNGKLPRFLNADIISQLLTDDPATPCIVHLRKGLDALGIYQLCRGTPTFHYLFQVNEASALTMRKLMHLLKPIFSEEGSNKRTFEDSIYAQYVKYVREVASGRREPLTLGSILQFATGSDEEPVLGFRYHPTIEFSEVENTFLPTANTCIGCLRLPRPTIATPLPSQETLFNLYDYAFSSSYFGNV
ncbi:uncharacterized protein [Ptychodera flava]|uniref:uncharacterized protein isoform X1 n=1 Tax=Ptychodera flava TaxID=63121 RepID=UPI00396A0FE4